MSGKLAAPRELRTLVDLGFLADAGDAGPLIVDLSAVSWVAPAAVAAILATCLKAQQSGREVQVQLPEDSSVLGYLDRIGMHDELQRQGWTIPTAARAPDAYQIHHHVPVTRVTSDQELEALGQRAREALSRAGFSSLNDPVFTVFSELTANAREHGSDCYALLQTHTGRTSGTPGIHLAVADFGPGFAQNLRPVLGELAPEAYIMKAFEEGVTSRPEPYRGFGLHHVARGIGEFRGAALEIASDGGHVRFDGATFSGTAFPVLPFTVASASFPVSLRDTEETDGAAPA